MAREVVEELIDDLDQSKSKGVETVIIHHTMTGRAHEIELHTAHRKELEAAIKTLQKYFDVARPIVSPNGKARSGGTARTSRTLRDENQAIREWAQAKGLEVAPRGRIKQDVIEQYRRRSGSHVIKSVKSSKAPSAPSAAFSSSAG